MPSDLEIPHSSYRNVRRSAGADPATRRLALIAGGLGGALVLVVGGWMMLGHHQTGVPLVMADPRPIRVKPVNPGGMQVVGANEDVMATQSGDGQDSVAPGPETPQVQALQAEIQAAKQAEAPPPATPPAESAQTVAPTQPTPALAAAPPSPASGPAVQPRVADATSGAGADGKAAGTQVQLAALGSEQAAHVEWQRLSKRFPALSGRQPAIERAEVDGRTVYRLRTGGFADMAAATEFCAQLRAKGAGCSIAAF